MRHFLPDVRATFAQSPSQKETQGLAFCIIPNSQAEKETDEVAFKNSGDCILKNRTIIQIFL